MRSDYLLVDGYNIIFAWPELKELAEDQHGLRQNQASGCAMQLTRAIKNAMSFLSLTATRSREIRALSWNTTTSM